MQKNKIILSVLPIYVFLLIASMLLVHIGVAQAKVISCDELSNNYRDFSNPIYFNGSIYSTAIQGQELFLIKVSTETKTYHSVVSLGLSSHNTQLIVYKDVLYAVRQEKTNEYRTIVTTSVDSEGIINTQSVEISLPTYGSRRINGLVVYNDKLYVAVGAPVKSSADTRKSTRGSVLLQFDGGVWEEVYQFKGHSIISLTALDDNLYLQLQGLGKSLNKYYDGISLYKDYSKIPDLLQGETGVVEFLNSFYTINRRSNLTRVSHSTQTVAIPALNPIRKMLNATDDFLLVQSAEPNRLVTTSNGINFFTVDFAPQFSSLDVQIMTSSYISHVGDALMLNARELKYSSNDQIYEYYSYISVDGLSWYGLPVAKDAHDYNAYYVYEGILYDFANGQALTLENYPVVDTLATKF